MQEPVKPIAQLLYAHCFEWPGFWRIWIIFLWWFGFCNDCL